MMTKLLKKILIKINNQTGSTIVELLISLMVVGLVATAIAMSGTYSIKNTGEARFKQVATTLAQEVIEKSRGEKNRLGFVNFASIVGNNTYNFCTLPTTFDNLSSDACSTGSTLTLAGANFTRKAVFSVTGSPASVIKIVVTVSWVDNGNQRQVEIIQEFKKPNHNF